MPGAAGAAGDLRAEHTAWAQRIHAVFFHQGAPAMGEGTLRSEQGLAALREAAAGCLSPAGQLQVAVALEVTAALDEQLHALRHQLPAPPGTWPARRSWPHGCTASGRSPRWR